MVGLDDLKGLLQPIRFCDSVILRLDCWNIGLPFKFKIDITEPNTTTSITPHLTSTPTVKDEKMLSPQISQIGPYAIKHKGHQQVLFNSSWSLK
ncbi:hypothetical protein QYF61_022810 [Mycteria americana]|uniref:Uncharacterized protein n=1 Tax=Mycteria americana TaxID=33587 RepID=A0AAN7SH28_MYCAM|nr:hypothetical protein QYF61_022810 [Mycteria americana]